MPLNVTEQWRKDLYRPIDPVQWARQSPKQRLKYGYGPRVWGTRVTNGVVHATHGRRGSSFANECRYLMRSQDVSAHYAVGRDGLVAHLLPEGLWTAWCNGNVIAPEWSNSYTVNIEIHAAVGERMTGSQELALQGLMLVLSQRWSVPREAWQVHRAIAAPAGRKSDPWFWPGDAFERWKDERL